jgi:hypothetical protein
MTIFRGRPALFSNQWEEIPYTGTQRRFVVAIDLGATQSAIHVALLSPGTFPRQSCCDCRHCLAPALFGTVILIDSVLP